MTLALRRQFNTHVDLRAEEAANVRTKVDAGAAAPKDRGWLAAVGGLFLLVGVPVILALTFGNPFGDDGGGPDSPPTGGGRSEERQQWVERCEDYWADLGQEINLDDLPESTTNYDCSIVNE